MPFRIIKTPGNITLSAPKSIQDTRPKDQKIEDATVTFSDFISRVMLHPSWGKSYAALRSAKSIEESVKASTGGDVVLAEEDWQRLRDLIEDPGNESIAYVAWGLLQLLPFMDAIVEARKRDEAPAGKRRKKVKNAHADVKEDEEDANGSEDVEAEA